MEGPRFAENRRRLLRAGLFGSLGLALAGGGYVLLRRRGLAGAAEDLRARTLIAALVPAMLAGALPAAAGRREAVAAVVDGVGAAIAGLSPAQREELGQLFALLNFSAGRFILAGVRSEWSEARVDEVDGFLRSWRASRFALFASAYAALHDLVLGSWYARPESWAAIGYPGPPSP